MEVTYCADSWKTGSDDSKRVNGHNCFRGAKSVLHKRTDRVSGAGEGTVLMMFETELLELCGLRSWESCQQPDKHWRVHTQLPPGDLTTLRALTDPDHTPQGAVE